MNGGVPSESSAYLFISNECLPPLTIEPFTDN